MFLIIIISLDNLSRLLEFSFYPLILNLINKVGVKDIYLL